MMEDIKLMLVFIGVVTFVITVLSTTAYFVCFQAGKAWHKGKLEALSQENTLKE